MITVEIIDSLNNKKIDDKKPRETVMEFIAEHITQKIRKNDRRPIVLRANVGLGKSTFLLYNLWKQNPGFNIFCSQVTITNTQEIANSMSEMFLDLKMGVNLGFQTGIKKITPSLQGHIVYQTIKITTNQILKPLLFGSNKGQPVNFSNSILIIDEAHSNDINMQEQLALVREVIANSTNTIPFIIVQSASIVLKDFKDYLQASFTIQTEGLRNKVIELYLDNFQFDRNKLLVGTGNNNQQEEHFDKQSMKSISKEDHQIHTDTDSENGDSDYQRHKNQLFESYLEAYNNREIDIDDISLNQIMSDLDINNYIDEYSQLMKEIDTDDYIQDQLLNQEEYFKNKSIITNKTNNNGRKQQKSHSITQENDKQEKETSKGRKRGYDRGQSQNNRKQSNERSNPRQRQSIDKGSSHKKVSEFVLVTEMIIMNIIEQSKIIQETVKEVNCDINGNILVFICKSSQMRDLQLHLQQNSKLKTKNIPIISLSAVLIEKDPTLIEQTRTPGQKIIIATSVVETGFTFTNLSYVIDGLKVRYVYYDPVKKCEIQRDLPIDKNMQQQRRGRVGRTQGGIYFGVCERYISDQLQEHREYQIQTTDLKQLICSIGFDKFKNMQFIGEIPIESVLDVLQYQYLFGFQLVESQKSEIFNVFMTDEKFKVKPVYKFLLMWSILQNIKICEVLMIVCFLEKFQSFPPTVIRNTKKINRGNQSKDRKFHQNQQKKSISPKQSIDTNKTKTKEQFKDNKQQSCQLDRDNRLLRKNILQENITKQPINQFASILQYLTTCDVSLLPSQYVQLYNDIILIFIERQINVYSGISILSKDQKEQEIVRKLFFDSFKQNILIHVQQNTYKTFNGLSVIVDLDSRQLPKYLVTNRIIDDLQILAQYVIECSLSDIQQVSNFW